MQDN